MLEGVLRLTRLAAERADREAGWRDVRDRGLEALVGWLVRQSDIVRQLSAPAFTGPSGTVQVLHNPTRVGGGVWVCVNG